VYFVYSRGIQFGRLVSNPPFEFASHYGRDGTSRAIRTWQECAVAVYWWSPVNSNTMGAESAHLQISGGTLWNCARRIKLQFLLRYKINEFETETWFSTSNSEVHINKIETFSSCHAENTLRPHSTNQPVQCRIIIDVYCEITWNT
jgi:hypothetical protein